MVQQVLQRFCFTYSSPQSTPLPTGHPLSAPPSDESVEPSGPYPELVGCLITLGMGLVLGGRARVVLTGHADASWVDDLATQQTSQGYSFSLGSAGAMAAQELRWLTYLRTDLGEAPRSPPVLYVDNKAMLALCQEHRTKHIALRYFLARELQEHGQLCLAYVASRANTTDVFTKALQPCDHQPGLVTSLDDERGRARLAPVVRRPSVPLPCAAALKHCGGGGGGGDMKQWKRLTGLATKGRAGDARAAERASGTPPGAQQAGGTGRARSSSAGEGMRGMAVTQTDSMEDEFQQGLQEVGEMRDKYERLLAAVADAQERAAECAEALHQLAAVVADAFGGVEEGGAGDTLLAAAAVDGRLAELLYFYRRCFPSQLVQLPSFISMLTPRPCVCHLPATRPCPPMPACPQSLHLQQTLAEPAEALLGEMQHVVVRCSTWCWDWPAHLVPLHRFSPHVPHLTCLASRASRHVPHAMCLAPCASPHVPRLISLAPCASPHVPRPMCLAPRASPHVPRPMCLTSRTPSWLLLVPYSHSASSPHTQNVWASRRAHAAAAVAAMARRREAAAMGVGGGAGGEAEGAGGPEEEEAAAREEFDEVAMTLGCRILALQQRQPRLLLTLALKHHAAKVGHLHCTTCGVRLRPHRCFVVK
ncbi:unnamed protein product [Closterium sp. NIES-53]